uniref:NAC domain-containing protein n=1 Tax=Fagus sylvatica TaxID=28930 RepID=A0A2N9EBU4_FAGSY
MKKNEEDMYVFTKLKKKSVKSSRFDRTVGEIGAWKGEDSGVKLYYEDKNNRGTITKVHGIRKRFRYESSCNSVQDGRWTMYEYSLDASMPIHAEFPDYVLCRIKKNDEPEKKRKLTEIMKENSSESKKPEHVAAIDTELQHGGNRVIIDLSDDDHDNSTSEDAPVINNIGTTLVAEQSNSMESPSENIDCTRLMIEAPGMNESLDPIYDVNDHSDWAIAFAEELMEGQPQLMQETEIEMLPNVYFHEDCLGSKRLN